MFTSLFTCFLLLLAARARGLLGGQPVGEFPGPAEGLGVHDRAAARGPGAGGGRYVFYITGPSTRDQPTVCSDLLLSEIKSCLENFSA